MRAAAVDRVRDEFKAHACRDETVLRKTLMSLHLARSAPSSTHRSIAQHRAPVIAGAANNQLAEDRDGEALQRPRILYAPDYVINAGGIISVSHEYYGGSTERQVMPTYRAFRSA